MRAIETAWVLLITGAVVAACGQNAETGDRSEQWRTHTNVERGYTVSLPSGWRVAPENLTPGLADPREILSVGTYALRTERTDRCRSPIDAPVPMLDRFDRRDVLISIQEMGITPRTPQFQRRRAHLRLQRLDLRWPGRRPRCMRRVGWEAFTGFSDGPRHFYAFVVVGRSATAARQGEAQRILDRLRFDPRKLPTWSSG